MKKEKYLPIALLMALTVILSGVHGYGQYAYNEDAGAQSFIEKIDKKKGVVDRRAIEEISVKIKNELDFRKERMNLRLEGDLLVETWISKNGTIENVQVIEGGNTDLNKLVESIVLNLKSVTPIAYDGETKRKAVWIPIKFRR